MKTKITKLCRYSFSAAALAALLLVYCCVSGGQVRYAYGAESESMIVVGEAGGLRGSEVSLAVSLNELNGTAGGNFTLCYDSSQLSLLSAEAGTALSGSVCTINKNYGVGKIRVSFASMSELESAGELLKLTFRISKDAALGLIPITIENAKLMDINSNTISRASKAGNIRVRAVEITANGGETLSCLAGQAVKLELALAGDLAPCGGEIELSYNGRMLSAGSVKAENKMGNTALNLSYSTDKEKNSVRISWAASEEPEYTGELCTVIFKADESAAGQTEVAFKSLKFYDKDGKRLDYLEPEPALIEVVEKYNPEATLYVVGGALSEDGKSANIQVAVDGAGLVCGGSFVLAFDCEKAALKSMEAKMGCVALSPGSAEEAMEAGELAGGGSREAGNVYVSWAEDSPALDNEAILELSFELKGNGPVELELKNVKLVGSSGSALEEIAVRGGKIGLAQKLQEPVTEVQNREDGISVSATLYDAGFCTEEEKTESATYVLATYSAGRLMTTELPEAAISFDHNGIAHVSAEISLEDEIDSIQLFILDGGGSLSPLCAGTEIDFKA